MVGMTHSRKHPMSRHAVAIVVDCKGEWYEIDVGMEKTTDFHNGEVYVFSERVLCCIAPPPPPSNDNGTNG